MPKVVNVNLQPTAHQNSIWASWTNSFSTTITFRGPNKQYMPKFIGELCGCHDQCSNFICHR